MTLRTDLTDDLPQADIHAEQHNEVNSAVLALQVIAGGSGGSLSLAPTDPGITPLTLMAAPGQTANLLTMTNSAGANLTWFDNNGTLWFSDSFGSSADLGWGSVMQGSMSGLLSTSNPILSTAWAGFGYFYNNNYGDSWTDPYNTGTAFVAGHNLDNGNLRFQIDSNGSLIWSSYDTNGLVWGNPDVIVSHGQSEADTHGTQGLRIMAGDWEPNVPVLSIIARGTAIHNWRNWQASLGAQTGDLLRIVDGETGDIWAKFDAEGRLSLTPNNPTFIPFIIKAASGQSGDLFDVVAADGTTLVKVNSTGTVVLTPGPGRTTDMMTVSMGGAVTSGINQNGAFYYSGGEAGYLGFQTNISGDSSYRFSISAGGSLWWQPGSGGPKVQLDYQQSDFLNLTGGLHITAPATTTVPLTIVGAAAVSTNLLEIRDSSDNLMAWWDNQGYYNQQDNSNILIGGGLLLRAAGTNADIWGNSNGILTIGSFGKVTVQAPMEINALGTANNFGGGTGSMLFMANDTTDPTSNPSGGGILFVKNGALMYRGSSGTVTTLAPA